MKVGAILLAGGKGSRMEMSIPKQFLPLQGKPVALYSLEVLLQLPQIIELIVVCTLEHRSLFSSYPVRFALPGEERQDSVYNGFKQLSQMVEWVIIHDAVRPFITPYMVQNLFDEGKKIGAATLAVPAKSTLKEAKSSNLVNRTLNRSHIWEIQTPQLLKKEILENGFAYAHAHAISVTDDVSLAELLDHPVHLVPGSYQNIKITTPDDWAFAQWYSNKKD